MSKSILLAGASGALGFKILKNLKSQAYRLRVITHTEEGLDELKKEVSDIHYLNAAEDFDKLTHITQDIDYVISALGKSVSLFHPDSDTFNKSNFKANRNLLKAAEINNVKKFVYVSMKGAESASNFTIPGTHRKTELELLKAKLPYSIIRPVGFFSGLHDLIIMARNKFIPVVGDGSARTNSIYHGDLANFIGNNFIDLPQMIEVGEPKIHTRLEMAKMIQKKIGGKIIKVPTNLAKTGSEIPKIFAEENLGHKLDYFSYIMSNDMIGQARGELTFKEYLEEIDLSKLD